MELILLKCSHTSGGVTHPYPEVTLATVNVEGNAGAETAEVNASSLVPRHDLGDQRVQKIRELVFYASRVQHNNEPLWRTGN